MSLSSPLLWKAVPEICLEVFRGSNKLEDETIYDFARRRFGYDTCKPFFFLSSTFLTPPLLTFISSLAFNCTYIKPFFRFSNSRCNDYWYILWRCKELIDRELSAFVQRLGEAIWKCSGRCDIHLFVRIAHTLCL
jgi:hypothetical protein